MLGTVNINGKTYEYTLEYKKIRNFNMRIRRDGSIYVSAPKSVSLKSVESFVLSNSKFIVRSVERFNIRMQNESDSEKFFDGCVKRIFGEDYILRFAVGDCREVRKAVSYTHLLCSGYLHRRDIGFRPKRDKSNDLYPNKFLIEI